MLSQSQYGLLSICLVKIPATKKTHHNYCDVFFPHHSSLQYHKSYRNCNMSKILAIRHFFLNYSAIRKCYMWLTKCQRGIHSTLVLSELVVCGGVVLSFCNLSVGWANNLQYTINTTCMLRNDDRRAPSAPLYQSQSNLTFQASQKLYLYYCFELHYNLQALMFLHPPPIQVLLVVVIVA